MEESSKKRKQEKKSNPKLEKVSLFTTFRIALSSKFSSKVCICQVARLTGQVPGILIKWQVLGLRIARSRVRVRPGSWSGQLSLPL